MHMDAHTYVEFFFFCAPIYSYAPDFLLKMATNSYTYEKKIGALAMRRVTFASRKCNYFNSLWKKIGAQIMHQRAFLCAKKTNSE